MPLFTLGPTACLYIISKTLHFALLYNPTSDYLLDINITAAPTAKYNCAVQLFDSEESFFEAAELLYFIVSFSIGVSSN